MDNVNRNILISLIKDRMVRTEADVTCAGGETTNVYLDIPGVLRDKYSLNVGTQVLLDHLIGHGLTSKATGIAGPQMGSIPLVMGLVTAGTGDPNLSWSIVRDAPKDHGLGSLFVGADLGLGDKVILVDDVVSSGNSIIEAYARVIETGAEVVAVVPLVHRGAPKGERFAPYFDRRCVPYLPVLTYEDLDIPALEVK